MKPICIKCRTQMRVYENEFLVKDKPAEGPGGCVYPPAVWSGDAYECPVCGTKIATGFGAPIVGARASRFGKAAMEFNY